VFAVAVMVWEALSGRKPFDGSSPADLALAMHLAPPVVPDEIPHAVGKVLKRAMAHDPAKRVATVTDLKRDLLAAFAV
jgi:eukaryotic-like serine/threonine-protein kinase